MTENQDEKDYPSYYAVIPADVRYADITPNAKLLYGEITALTSKTGTCYATNKYFANLYKVSKVSISKWIKELVDNGFITSEVKYKENSKEIEGRHIRILLCPIKEKFNTPIKEKLMDNNTSNNNINNNINIYKERKYIKERKKPKGIYNDYSETYGEDIPL